LKNNRFKGVLGKIGRILITLRPTTYARYNKNCIKVDFSFTSIVA